MSMKTEEERAFSAGCLQQARDRMDQAEREYVHCAELHADKVPDPRCDQASTANSIRPNFVQAYQLTPEVSREIEAAFQYQPWDREKERHGCYVRDALTLAVKVIIDHVPPSADRTAAIRKIREARMDCNSAITHGGRY